MELTERERWLMTEPFMRGYEWGHDDTVTNNYMTRSKRTSELCREWLDTESQVGATFGQALADMAPKTPSAWRPIETAPKDGTEILGWRKDAGALLVRWTCMDEFMTDREIEESDCDEETTASEDWFYADFMAGGRLDGNEAPTHWMPLPEAPPESKTRIDAMDAWTEEQVTGIDDADPS